MEGTLVFPLSVTEPTVLSDLLRQLCRDVGELRQEVGDLRRENAELRQQVGYWKAQHARAVHRAEQLEAEVERACKESCVRGLERVLPNLFPLRRFTHGCDPQIPGRQARS
jgi:hypothetical protein